MFQSIEARHFPGETKPPKDWQSPARWREREPAAGAFLLAIWRFAGRSLALPVVARAADKTVSKFSDKTVDTPIGRY